MALITTAALATALSPVFYEMGKKLFEDSVVDPATKPFKDKLSALVGRAYRSADDKVLQKAIQNALSKLGENVEGEGDPLQRWLKGKTLDRLAAKGNDPLRRRLARAIVEFADPAADPPDDLLIALGWPRSDRQQLAQLLSALRWELAQLDEWKPLIEYANALAAQQQLQQMLASLAKLDQLFVETASGAALRVALTQQQLSKETAVAIEERYRQDLIAELRNHDFRGIYQVKHDLRLPLADIYSELGLLPLGNDEERKQAHKEVTELREMERQAQEERRHAERISDALAEAQRLVVLGEPGSGKTMSLRFITLMLAYGFGVDRFGLNAPFIPLYIRLADFARELERDGALSLDRFLLDNVSKRYFTPQLPEFLRSALESGACMALLDGMDEVGDDPAHGLSLRTRVVKAVQTFGDRWCNENRPNRLVVTSRIEGYWGESLRACQHVQLSPLRPPDEIEAFLLRWFVAHEQSHDRSRELGKVEVIAKSKTEQMLSEIMSNASVRRLATNPLLLTILTLIHDNLGRLPNRRAKLYDICIRTLVESWRQAQTDMPSNLLKELGEETVLRILAPMAYWLHEERPGGTATYEEWHTRLCQIIQEDVTDDAAKAEQMALRFLHHARHETGLLSERGLGQYGFFHLTFEEALAARQIARQNEKNRQQMIRNHWEDPRWYEVILLAVGHLGLVMERSDDAKGMLLELLDMQPTVAENQGRQVILAGRALADIGEQNISPFARNTVKHNLRFTMQDLNPQSEKPNQPPVIASTVRYAAGEVLDELGWLPDDLNQWVLCEKCADGEGRRRGDLLAMRYPVTNAQFAVFVESDGYSNPAYWDGEESMGWQWMNQYRKLRFKELRHEPYLWRDNRFGCERKGYPVVGVSWYEATAFATWLTTLLIQIRKGASGISKKERVLVADLIEFGATSARLPTELEWERLAGGCSPKERYPWDSRGQATKQRTEIIARANTIESMIHGTSPVAMYPLGASQPYDLFDVGGNIWEWTDSWYDTNNEYHAFRGGSWNDSRELSYCIARADRYPGFASSSWVGFRLVSPISSGG